jgi:preprotein translocase subunit SecD
MNLYEELEHLAAGVDVPVDVDSVLDQARRVRVTRVAATAGVVVLALLLAVAIPSARRAARIQPAGPARVHVSVTVTAVADRASVERARQTVLNRARAAGLRNPQAGMVGDHTFIFSADSGNRQMLLALVQPGELRIRRVLAAAGMYKNPTFTEAVPRSSSTVPSLASVITKLGDAYQVAQGVHDPNSVDGATLARLAGFRGLSADEVSVLPPEMQYAVPTISCAQLNQRRPFSISAADQRVAACDPFGYDRYLLDVAVMTTADVADARPANKGENTGGWVVTLTFTAQGQPKWTELTRLASGAGEPLNQVAFVVDNSVVGAPHVLSEIRGSAEVAADDEYQARMYAGLLSPPSMSLVLTAA